MANQKEKLFSDFPPISTEEWMAKITADLKGADFEKKLVWRTNEGFNVNPSTEVKTQQACKRPIHFRANFLTFAVPRKTMTGTSVRIFALMTSRLPMQRLLTYCTKASTLSDLK